MIEPMDFLRKKSPYFADCLERFFSSDIEIKEIRKRLDAGRVREALSLALETKDASGESAVLALLLAECYLACDLIDPALPLLHKALDPARSTLNGSAVYIANQPDLAAPLLVMAITRSDSSAAAVALVIAKYTERIIGDRGALCAGLIEEGLGEADAAQAIYLEIVRSSDSRSSVIQCLSRLFPLLIARDNVEEAASLVLAASQRFETRSLFPDSLKLTDAAKALLDSTSLLKGTDFESRLLYLLGEREQFGQCLAKYAEIAGQDTGLYEDLTCYAWETGDEATVDECISYALGRLLPLNNPAFLSITARRLASKGDLAQAVETFGLALKAAPGFEDALRGLNELTLKVERMEAGEANVGAKPSKDNETGSDRSYVHLINARRHLSRGELRDAKLEALLSTSFGEELKEEASAVIYECRRLADSNFEPDRIEKHDGDDVPSILIASPVRQKPAILKEFLTGLTRLNTSSDIGRGSDWTPAAPAMSLDFLFADDNQDPESATLLGEFKPPSGRVFVCPVTPDGVAYHCDDVTHKWSGDLMEKVGTIKDFMIEFAIQGGYDYLFLADSDLVLHPNTLKRLLWTDRDIVSEVFWTKWQPGAIELPQVWLKNHYDLAEFAPGEHIDKAEASRRAGMFVATLRIPGTYQVGGLGACTLIKTKSLESGLRFRKIENMSLRGEDRDFCVRAVALGHSLNAETSHPPLHLYRDEDLARVPGFWGEVEKYAVRIRLWYPQGARSTAAFPRRTRRGGKLTLSMLVRNEADRYLPEVLRNACCYIDDAVILDDASDDSTVEVCRSIFEKAGVPLTIVSNKEPGFNNEITLRKQLWDMTGATDPDWILLLDADEIFEDAMKREVKRLLDQDDIDLFRFRLYDMWDPEHYRDDVYWTAHKRYFALLTRYQPGFSYVWKETPLHCGRFPMNVINLPIYCSHLRVKHLGWMNPSDRQRKYARYMEADPEGRHGILAQYKSILDENPRLVRWVE